MNLQRFGMERAAKVESLQEIILTPNRCIISTVRSAGCLSPLSCPLPIHHRTTCPPAICHAGRRLERHEPVRCDAKPVQIVQTPYQPVEIAYTIPFCIHEGAYRKAIDHRVLVPKIIDHCVQTSTNHRKHGVQSRNACGERFRSFRIERDTRAAARQIN